MAKMTVDEMIRKFSIEVVEQNGKKGIRVSGKPGKLQVEQLKANKDAIISELEKRYAVRDARKAEEKAKRDAEIEGIKNGSIKIKIIYHDGEYLSGYEVVGEAAGLLEEIGFAEYVSGWGCHIPSKAIEELGKEFTYQAAIEYMQPAHEAAEAKKAQAQAERQAKFDEANVSGKKVLLRRWSQGCCDPKEECSLDMHSEWAMPDGTTEYEWHHTW